MLITFSLITISYSSYFCGGVFNVYCEFNYVKAMMGTTGGWLITGFIVCANSTFKLEKFCEGL